jgi:hypothetical protein
VEGAGGEEAQKQVRQCGTVPKLSLCSASKFSIHECQLLIISYRTLIKASILNPISTF